MSQTPEDSLPEGAVPRDNGLEGSTPDGAALETAVSPPASPASDTASADVPTGAPIDPAAHPALAKQGRTGLAAAVAASLAVGAVLGGVAGGGVAYWATSQNASAPAVTSGPGTITVNDRDDATLITAVATAAMPSVVTISVTGQAGGGTGSGVVLSEDGYIVTNAHVVTLDGATSEPQLRVQTSDGRLLEATVVGVDPIYDLAVIKVEAGGLTPIEFADSGDLNVGDTAIAIGGPLGLAGTVTNGIVSALNRSITVASSAVPDQGDVPAPDEQSPFDFWNFDMGEDAPAPAASSTISLAVIQTDAAINPGNSGGALLDADGRLIGINVAIASAGSAQGQAGSIGVGFAIPSAIAQRVVSELIETGTATHGLLGATVSDVQNDENQKDAEVVGASIVELTSGGAAERGGLQVGDIVTAFNGLPVTNRTDLTAQVRALAAGADATVTYVRDGQERTTDVTLGALQ